MGFALEGSAGCRIEVIGVVGARVGAANVVNGGVKVLESLNRIGLVTKSEAKRS